MAIVVQTGAAVVMTIAEAAAMVETAVATITFAIDIASIATHGLGMVRVSGSYCSRPSTRRATTGTRSSRSCELERAATSQAQKQYSILAGGRVRNDYELDMLEQQYSSKKKRSTKKRRYSIFFKILIDFTIFT